MRAAALHHPVHRPERRFRSAAVRALACPHCGADLVPQEGAFVCRSGHTFDIAKQGYVALLGARARTDTGDSADMVAARSDFLSAGHYAAIANAIGSGYAGPVLEIGAGTGYYLSAALGDADDNVGIAIDASKFAARRSAADARVLSVVGDAWSALPLRADSVGTVLSVFAPRDAVEIARVLAPGGHFVAVTPTPAHLLELREQLSMLTVDEGKAERLAETFAAVLEPVGQQEVRFSMQLNRADVSALVRMGPSARHLTAAELRQQISGLKEMETVTCAVTVSTFLRSRPFFGLDPRS